MIVTLFQAGQIRCKQQTCNCHGHRHYQCQGQKDIDTTEKNLHSLAQSLPQGKLMEFILLGHVRPCHSVLLCPKSSVLVTKLIQRFNRRVVVVVVVGILLFWGTVTPNRVREKATVGALVPCTAYNTPRKYANEGFVLPFGRTWMSIHMSHPLSRPSSESLGGMSTRNISGST